MRRAVRALLEAQSGGAELLDCSTCTRSEDACPVCPVTTGAQPRITVELAGWMRLYDRARTYRALPALGGLDDQEERIMRRLDLIHEEVSAHRRRIDQRDRARMESQRHLGRGH